MAYDPSQTNNRNPLNKNIFWRHERHNSCKIHNLYDHMLVEATNIFGVTIVYYPVTEYSLDSLTSIWGEYVNKGYNQRYVMKALPEQGENDNFQFNSFGGIDKSESERILYIPKEQFTTIVGRENPLPSDWLLYTQNNIVYEVVSLDDNEGIIAGKEMYWKVVLSPRIIEGEKLPNCGVSKEDIIDPTPEEYCESLDNEFNDNGVTDEIPSPTPENNDNDVIEDVRDSNSIIRNSSSNWGSNW